MASDLTQQAGNHYYHKRLNPDHNKTLQFDWTSVRNFGITGTVCLAPIMFYWYKLLDRWMPGKTVRVIIPKVIVDQGVLAPNTLALFFIGKTVSKIQQENN